MFSRMAQAKGECGYTIVEILVSLILLSILLFFSVGILRNITSGKVRQSRYLAIETAKAQMRRTLEKRSFRDTTLTVDKRLVLQQSVRYTGTLYYVTIMVYNKNSKKVLYELQAIRKRE